MVLFGAAPSAPAALTLARPVGAAVTLAVAIVSEAHRADVRVHAARDSDTHQPQERFVEDQSNARPLIDFKPTALGISNASLVLATSDPDQPTTTIQLVGTGI